jgi:hypothetical protein
MRAFCGVKESYRESFPILLVWQWPCHERRKWQLAHLASRMTAIIIRSHVAIRPHHRNTFSLVLARAR